MKQYIRDKIVKKLQSPRYKGLLVGDDISDHMIDSIYQTLSSERVCCYEIQIDDTMSIYIDSFRLVPVTNNLTIELYLAIRDSISQGMADTGLFINFDIVEYREQKLDQLLVSN